MPGFAVIAVDHPPRAEPFVAQGIYESIRVVEWAPAFNTLATVDWPK